jgi:hypothetical protein
MDPFERAGCNTVTMWTHDRSSLSLTQRLVDTIPIFLLFLLLIDTLSRQDVSAAAHAPPFTPRSHGAESSQGAIEDEAGQAEGNEVRRSEGHEGGLQQDTQGVRAEDKARWDDAREVRRWLLRKRELS